MYRRTDTLPDYPQRRSTSDDDERPIEVSTKLVAFWVRDGFPVHLKLLWYGYQTLYSHFKKALKDKNRTTIKRAMYGGLIKRLTST
ncbi:hypothetical protein WA026_001354 [Henosepilachna vigintioctopunctata]|uniref:Transposase n=1 Tax=Henosepilachna vigintioctopunctata TaxID=420089 RepID=A0AAW1UT51_9CUCU